MSRALLRSQLHSPGRARHAPPALPPGYQAQISSRSTIIRLVLIWTVQESYQKEPQIRQKTQERGTPSRDQIQSCQPSHHEPLFGWLRARPPGDAARCDVSGATGAGTLDARGGYLHPHRSAADLIPRRPGCSSQPVQRCKIAPALQKSAVYRRVSAPLQARREACKGRTTRI